MIKLGEVVVWAQSAKERGLTATFPPFLRLTILISGTVPSPWIN